MQGYDNYLCQMISFESLLVLVSQGNIEPKHQCISALVMSNYI